MLNYKNILINSLRKVPDYPKEGILFWDITTLINDSEAFHLLLDHLYGRYKDMNIDCIAGAEARGFIFGAALSARLRNRFVPIRKKNKLPSTTIAEKYALEYGFDQVEIHLDAFEQDGKKVLFVDDLIATGGTAKASINLIQKAGGEVVEACFIVDLVELGGTKLIKDQVPVYSVLEV